VTKLELFYIAMRGPAESPRLALAIGDMPFKNNAFLLDKFRVKSDEQDCYGPV
jgi:hypothetical protein